MILQWGTRVRTRVEAADFLVSMNNSRGIMFRSPTDRVSERNLNYLKSSQYITIRYTTYRSPPGINPLFCRTTSSSEFRTSHTLPLLISHVGKPFKETETSSFSTPSLLGFFTHTSRLAESPFECCTTYPMKMQESEHAFELTSGRTIEMISPGYVSTLHPEASCEIVVYRRREGGNLLVSC